MTFYNLVFHQKKVYDLYEQLPLSSQLLRGFDVSYVFYLRITLKKHIAIQTNVCYTICTWFTKIHILQFFSKNHYAFS